MTKTSRIDDPQISVQQHFDSALSALIEDLKSDRSVLAAILCGSLAHDTVWSKSDIDLLLVTIDDKSRNSDAGICLYADGVNVHASLVTRAEFRKAAEGSLRNSFFHSLLAKGRLVYTHDETIADLCARLSVMGGRDLRLQLMCAGSEALRCLYKAQKWLVTREDLEYTALWILYTAEALAKIELLRAGLLVDREALPRAVKLNPPLFKLVYTDLLNSKKTRPRVEAASHAIEEYMATNTSELFAPILEHLEEVREARSATEIEDHFRRNFGIGGVTIVCEYLADQDLIGKAPLPVRLTKRSNVDVNELSFFRGSSVPDAF